MELRAEREKRREMKSDDSDAGVTKKTSKRKVSKILDDDSSDDFEEDGSNDKEESNGSDSDVRF
jgi:hypothetical protein